MSKLAELRLQLALLDREIRQQGTAGRAEAIRCIQELIELYALSLSDFEEPRSGSSVPVPWRRNKSSYREIQAPGLLAQPEPQRP